MDYSFVVPIFNDGDLAADFCREMEKTFREYLKTKDISESVEVIFVDDGSQNDSPKLLKKLCYEFPFVKVLILMRNFGHHIAVSAGYRAVRGEYVGMLNVDQEDPPNQLPLLIDALRDSDYDIIGGLYSHKVAPPLTRVTSYFFHLFLSRLTGYEMPPNASTVRVMKRSALESYNSLSEKSRYIPGLEMWLGFRYGRIPVAHQQRRAGTSSYNFRRRLRMAVASIISFSDFPLRLTVKFGVCVAALGAILSMVFIADKLFFRAYLPGYTSTIAILVVLGGAQIVVTGVASLYIGRILAEVQGRPLFLIRETHVHTKDAAKRKEAKEALAR